MAPRRILAWAQTEGVLMQQRQTKVLIADDSSTVHHFIGDALPAEYSANVIHAFDGVECLHALDHGVELAFIDVHMPTMGGMDALWSARIAGNKTFVTLISGRPNRRCIELARQLDAYEFLTKPFDSEDIAAILSTYQRVATPMQVLLVDDSHVSLKVMRKVLANSIFRLNIAEAHSGAEAVKRCNAETFDVVFLDVNMPGLNGYATLGRLMQANPRAEVVMISAEQNAALKREAFKLGAAAMMQKPFFPPEIDAVLHRIFGLQSPKLATEGCVRDFGIRIHGRTIAVEHAESGHIYEYIWFREPPYLRLPLVRENEKATIPVTELMANAKKAALLELEGASLLQPAQAAA
jgi:CheY-like chemotaxis protein